VHVLVSHIGDENVKIPGNDLTVLSARVFVMEKIQEIEINKINTNYSESHRSLKHMSRSDMREYEGESRQIPVLKPTN
jgi:hypothetical protein